MGAGADIPDANAPGRCNTCDSRRIARQEKHDESTSDGQSHFSSAADATVRKRANRTWGVRARGCFKNGTAQRRTCKRAKHHRINNGGDGLSSYDQIPSSEELDRLVAYLKTL
jgi:hypothetical protein